MVRPAALACPPPQARSHTLKQDLHRSITFWSGILVMAFICWAWRDSMHSKMVAQVGDARIHSAGGEIGFIHWPDGSPGYQNFQRRSGRFKVIDNVPAAMMAAPLKPGEERSLFKRPRLGRGKNTLYLPHWLFLIPVILPWSALLLWRARRRKRALTL